MYRNNPSPKRKALRAKYRKKHGDDWWQDDKIKARFDKEMKGGKPPAKKYTKKKAPKKYVKRKGTRKISKPKDIYDKVYNQLLKHLDPLVPKGISGPSWIDAEVVGWQLGDESLLIMTDNKDEWFFEIIPDKKGINQVSLILGNRSKLTPTKIAKEVVKLYKKSKVKPTKRRKR